MKRVALTVTVSVTVLAFAPTALASSPTRAHVRQYLRSYSAVQTRFGHRVPGCNLITRRGSCHIRATDNDLVKSLAILDRMLVPPRASEKDTVAPNIRTAGATVISLSTPVVASVTGYGCGGTTPYSGGGQCWAIPYTIVQCESGGQNVPNSQGSGANGYYQLMSGGGGSRAQQDAAASALWHGGKGASNWTCK